jgi:RNA polymerase sigma factor (sigma-70 family)
VNARLTQRPTHVDFDAVFDEHYADLVRYCRRLTGEDDAAEDIAQESVFRLFSHEVRAGPIDVRAWLFTTATNLARDRYRTATNRRRLLEVHPVRPNELESPDRALERAERRAGARAALDTMAPRDKEILLMRYSGFSYREIAEAVGVAAASIGTLLSRAERRFAEAVRQMEMSA